MNEEIDDAEFYHQDFTTASEWEIFIARLEEIITQWKTDDLKSVEDSPDIWDIKTEKVLFAEFEFNFTLYKKNDVNEATEESNDEKPKKNPLATLHDFELYDESKTNQDSCISTWYGLKEYLVLSPSKDAGITSESRIKILLSSIYILSSNLNCEIPIFVQIQEKWQKCYLGVYEVEGVRSSFEMVHLKRCPPYCQHLNGLLDLFKSKIASPVTIDSIVGSAQFTYVLSNFGNYTWKEDLHNTETDSIEIEHFSVLPFGVTIDPISSILLKTTWSRFSSRAVVDTESHSSFDPIDAPAWSVLVKMTNEPLCLLAESLTEIQQLFSNTNTAYDLLGVFAVAPSPEINPLDLLTEPAVPTISTIFNKATKNSVRKNSKAAAPIAENLLVPLLYFLFPDADNENSFPYRRETVEDAKETEQEQEQAKSGVFKTFEQECKGCKTCGIDSLTWRLAIVLAHTLQSLGGVKSFAHIWYEFVQEMRYRWEKSMPIPGISRGFPDFRTCLLNQKLQMLNCCIERKLARENLTAPRYESAEDSSTDDEFFDCSEKPDDEAKRREKYAPWNQPVGRLGKFKELKLLKTGDPLYIPITQEPVIKTEDQLEEDTDVLLNLGSNAEATELRARIMSASLLSDMESFKAANPGSIVEDFIRWYSPRDWIEQDDLDLDEWGQKRGQLSPRMLIEDNNIWVETWEAAKPVPANRQKRLFDDTREAEKILQFLDYRVLSQVCELIVPVLAHAAIYKLAEECQMAEPADAAARVSSLTKHAEKISRDCKFQPRRFETFIQEVTALELLVSQVNSLQFKLNPAGTVNDEVGDLIGSLVAGKEIEIVNKGKSDVGGRIISMFAEEMKMSSSLGREPVVDGARNVVQNALPAPSEKEYVLRTNAVRPASYSARCPQFLRAVVSKNEFRLVGAFSEDITFF